MGEVVRGFGGKGELNDGDLGELGVFGVLCALLLLLVLGVGELCTRAG